MSSRVDWASVAVHSRAARGAEIQRAAPVPTIDTTPEGDAPLGDATMWGQTVSQVIHVPAGTSSEAPLTVIGEQVARAQVVDRRARRWGWMARFDLSLLTDPFGLDVLDFGIDWTLGVGLATMEARMSAFPLIFITNLVWQPKSSPTSFSVIVHDAANLTPVLGEVISARPYIVASNDDEADAASLRLTVTLLVQPEALR
jgi:hypothetical protein